MAVVALAVVSLVTGQVTAGATPVSDRQSNISVYSASMGRDITVRVIRPADTSVPRPALYLLGGVEGSSDEHGWTENTDLVEFTADKNVNVVIPYGGASSYYTDWQQDDPALGRNKWTTFLTQELPPVINSVLGTTGRNAIAGLSMSGTSVLNLAIAAPGLYRAVGSYSGCALSNDPLGKAYIVATVVNFFGDPINMWGPLDGPGWADHDPYLNAEGLRGTQLYISNGSGLPGPHDTLAAPGVLGDPAELTAQIVRGGPIEAATGQCTQRLAARLDDLGIPATVNLRPTGTHSWGYWQDEFHRSWPMFAEAIGA
ncbi:MAG: alpha/beta hydrolase family protein [Rhodococcus sp. (in: high G+C Gram-positive bacteria)]